MLQPQRPASLPQFQPPYHQIHHFNNQHAQYTPKIQGGFQPQIIQQTPSSIPQYNPQQQQRVIQNPTNYPHSPASYFTSNNKQPFVYSSNNTPISRVSNHQMIPFQYHSINASPNTQKRGVSVPVKLSYQNSTPQQLKFSPIPLDQNQSPIHLDSSTSKPK